MTAPSHAPAGSGFEAWLPEAALQAALAPHLRPAVFAISGVQGSGKSTLAAQVATLARGRGLRVAVLSIDDFYLQAARRRQLAAEVHPLLATRGPPGTHDLPLALAVMARLRGGLRVRLPRFDKLADDRVRESEWTYADTPLDLVLLEGWLLGVPPQQASDLVRPLNALERTEDAGAQWRAWCNAALAHEYPPLWRQLDALWMLAAPSFDVVPAWRWQQEQSLLARSPMQPGMSRAQLERFVQLFERVSRHALHVLPALAQRVIHLDQHRRPLQRAGEVPGAADPLTGPRK